MSNPGPPGEDDRPLTGPDAGMGLPESGTQHATSTDFALPLDPPAEPDPLTAGASTGGTQPSAYEDPSELVDPGYDEPADLLDAGPEIDLIEPAAPEYVDTPAYDALASETGFAVPEPTDADGGVLAKLKAFADERPAAFLAAALVAGWLVGKLLGSSDDDDEEG